MPIQALILAAGRGSRLGTRTAEIPKPLLQIGPRPLIEHQLETYADAGVGPIGMVVGYQADEIAEMVGLRADYITNHRWATTNSLYSFLQARDWVQGDVIISNCDILFHPEIIGRLLASDGDAFAFDPRSGHGLEHMKVELDGGYLKRMSKTLPPEEVDGENVGLLYLKHHTVQRLFAIAERLIAEGGTKEWLGVAVQQLAGICPLKAVDIAGLPWAEIDFAFDLARARKEVWPAIQKKRARWWRTARVRAAAGLAAFPLILGALTAFKGDDAKPGTVEWRTLPMDGGTPVVLRNGSHRQTWWDVKPGSAVGTFVDNGGVIVESRSLVASETTPAPYRLEIAINGELADWKQHHGGPVSSRQRGRAFATTPSYDFVAVRAPNAWLTVTARSLNDSPVLVRVRQAEHSLPGDNRGRAARLQRRAAAGRSTSAPDWAR